MNRNHCRWLAPSRVSLLAVAALLGIADVASSQTPAKVTANNQVTFTKDIVPILRLGAEYTWCIRLINPVSNHTRSV